MIVTAETGDRAAAKEDEMSEANKQEQQQEPSMEEILASIRRIISDDGSEPDSAAPGEAKAPAGAEAAQEKTDSAEPKAGEEPLELTQAIQGDGTVIDLAAQRANQASEAPDPQTPPEPEALAEAPEPQAPAPVPEPEAEIEPEIEAEDREPQETQADALAEASLSEAPQWDSPRPEDAPVEAPAEPESEGGLELYGEDEATPAAEVAADQPPPEPEPEPEPEPAEESMSERPTVEEIEAERLVSEATEAATLAALSGVSRPGSNTAQPLSLPGGERTLEQVVRDAIAEHLKTWLDANLPTLVERVVREEVRRLARRAEDL